MTLFVVKNNNNTLNVLLISLIQFKISYFFTNINRFFKMFKEKSWFFLEIFKFPNPTSKKSINNNNKEKGILVKWEESIRKSPDVPTTNQPFSL